MLQVETCAAIAHQTAMRFFAGLFALVLIAGDPPPITLYRLALGFEMPTGIWFPPDGSGRMFVVEQRGSIRIIKNGMKLDRPFLDLRAKVSCCDERGLLGLAFSPSFRTNRTFYVNYTDPQGNTVVSRLRLSGSDNDLADAISEQVILQVTQPYANHNGGNLIFGPEGICTWVSGMAAVRAIRKITPSVLTHCSGRCCASTWNRDSLHIRFRLQIRL